MNVNYDIDPKRRLVILRYGGVGGFSVWQATFRAAVADPRYRPGEGMVNTWQAPLLGDLTVRGGYVEGKMAFSAGWFAAGRYDVLRFDDLQGTGGPARPWDADVTRFEGGLGYRIDRHVTAKAVYQSTKRDPGPGAATAARTDNLLAAQVVIGF
jgi:hypothetical protein